MPSTITLESPQFGDEVDWPGLGNTGIWSDIEYVPTPSPDPNPLSIAVRVLQQYDIPYVASDVTGGTLDGYDIYNMDATNAIRLSLLEHLEDEKFVELYANNEGDAEFIDVGALDFTGEPRYNVPNRKIINRTEQVRATGFNPPSMVYVRGPFDILVGEDGGEPEIIDDIANMMQTTCYEEVFNRYATVMYRTPVLKSTWNDTLDSLYNVGEFESILGWIHNIEIDDTNISTAAEVIFSDTTPYPYEVSFTDFDDTYIRYNIDAGTTQEVSCFIPSAINFDEQGLTITIPNSTYHDADLDQELSDVLDVRQIFLMGYEVIYTYVISEGGRGSLTCSCKHRRIPYNLSEGSDYAWGFDNAGNMKIAFGVGQTEADVYLESQGIDITQPYTVIGGPYFDANDGQGPLGNHRMWPHLGGSYTGGAGDGFGTTYLFDSLYVIVGRKKSSLTIYDPDGNADEALRNSIYNMYAIVSCDPPAPVAGAGIFTGGVDFKECEFDSDPMTVQDLTDCDVQELAAAMNGASIDLTLPFVDDIDIIIDQNNTTLVYYADGKLETIASFVLDLTNEIIDETTYVLGPDATPSLGMSYRDGIINNISYAYQDSSSYLITIGTGPRYLKDTVSANDASIWQINVETVTKEGIVTQIAGNGIHYAVHIEGLGDYIAVNTVSNQFPPEVGDRVTVEINNVPVGWK
jgi:hypothetical protein